jgi:uncharacterized membrane protein
MYVAMRWLHIVCTTLVVGGTLFFEFVVPIAVEDLKTEQQLTVTGKARWVFRRVIWPCAILLLMSGAVGVLRRWEPPGQHRDVFWAGVAHVVLGVAALGIALMLTVPRSPPDRAVGWMRFNLGVLLLCIVAATIARHTRFAASEREGTMGRNSRALNVAPVTTMPK